MMNPEIANMDPIQNPGDILLRVKSANHPSCEDLEFHAKFSYSVKQIKETIQKLSSQHPEVKEQRLIYSGHLLDDNQLLKDVLGSNGGFQLQSPEQPVTIHLACTSKYIFNSPTSSTKQSTTKPADISENDMQNPAMGLGFTTPNFSLPSQATSEEVPQDLISLHQSYIQQMNAYMNQWYMHQGMMNGMFYQMPAATGVSTNLPFAHLHAPIQNHIRQRARNNIPEANQNGPVNPPAAENVNVPQGREQPNANLAAARAADDDENQRDIIDWMYTVSRMVLILSVVYFYSSFSRFFLVVLFSAVVFILQRRNRLLNHNNNNGGRPRAEADAANPQGNRPQQNQNQNGENQVNNEDEGSNENSNNNNAPNEEQHERNLSEIARTFFVTFFTSLIPDYHH